MRKTGFHLLYSLLLGTAPMMVSAEVLDGAPEAVDKTGDVGDEVLLDTAEYEVHGMLSATESSEDDELLMNEEYLAKVKAAQAASTSVPSSSSSSTSASASLKKEGSKAIKPRTEAIINEANDKATDEAIDEANITDTPTATKNVKKLSVDASHTSNTSSLSNTDTSKVEQSNTANKASSSPNSLNDVLDENGVAASKNEDNKANTVNADKKAKEVKEGNVDTSSNKSSLDTASLDEKSASASITISPKNSTKASKKTNAVGGTSASTKASENVTLGDTAKAQASTKVNTQANADIDSSANPSPNQNSTISKNETSKNETAGKKETQGPNNKASNEASDDQDQIQNRKAQGLAVASEEEQEQEVAQNKEQENLAATNTNTSVDAKTSASAKTNNANKKAQDESLAVETKNDMTSAKPQASSKDEAEEALSLNHNTENTSTSDTSISSSGSNSNSEKETVVQDDEANASQKPQVEKTEPQVKTEAERSTNTENAENAGSADKAENMDHSPKAELKTDNLKADKLKAEKEKQDANLEQDRDLYTRAYLEHMYLPFFYQTYDLPQQLTHNLILRKVRLADEGIRLVYEIGVDDSMGPMDLDGEPADNRLLQLFCRIAMSDGGVLHRSEGVLLEFFHGKDAFFSKNLSYVTCTGRDAGLVRRSVSEQERGRLDDEFVYAYQEHRQKDNGLSPDYLKDYFVPYALERIPEKFAKVEANHSLELGKGTELIMTFKLKAEDKSKVAAASFVTDRIRRTCRIGTYAEWVLPYIDGIKYVYQLPDNKVVRTVSVDVATCAAMRDETVH